MHDALQGVEMTSDIAVKTSFNLFPEYRQTNWNDRKSMAIFCDSDNLFQSVLNVENVIFVHFHILQADMTLSCNSQQIFFCYFLSAVFLRIQNLYITANLGTDSNIYVLDSKNVTVNFCSV